MKRILVVVLVAIHFVSCDKSKTQNDQIPKCDDSESITLTKDIVRHTIAASEMTKLSGKHTPVCLQQLAEYSVGKKFDKETTIQMKKSLTLADSIFLGIEDINTTTIDEKLKKCDCNATLIFKDNETTPISYSVKKTKEGTFAEITH